MSRKKRRRAEVGDPSRQKERNRRRGEIRRIDWTPTKTARVIQHHAMPYIVLLSPRARARVHTNVTYI